MTKRLGLLGPGHVGKWVIRSWLEQEPTRTCFVVSRSPWSEASLGNLEKRIDVQQFELGSSQTRAGALERLRDHLFQCDVVLATFPLCGPSASSGGVFSHPHENPFMQGIISLFESFRQRGVTIGLLSSSSGYQTQEGLISEDSPWRAEDPRYGFEDWLRQNLDVNVLILPGLFGDQREPKHWLEKGWVRDWRGSVNLLHHADAGLLVTHVLSHPLLGQRLNISSGELHFWPLIAQMTGVCPSGVDTIERDQACQKIIEDPFLASGKVISNQKLLSLYPELRNFPFRRYP